MASTVENIVNNYKYVIYDLADPRTINLPLIETPWPCLFLVIFYNLFVLKIGPELMKNRKPLNIDRIIQIYNLVQVICSGLLFYLQSEYRRRYLVDPKATNLSENMTPDTNKLGMKYTYISGSYNIWCENVDPSKTDPDSIFITRLCYSYFILKIVDLGDTIFFVLRKKDNQITLLHMYHHTGMIGLTWTGTKYTPGGHGMFLGLINDFVHMVMYFYYFLTNYNPDYRKKIWWKKYLTQLQMVQFVLIIIHFLMLLWAEPCGYPRWTAYWLIPFTSYMLYLFMQFYRSTYSTNENNNKISGKRRGGNGRVLPKIAEVDTKIHENGRLKTN